MPQARPVMCATSGCGNVGQNDRCIGRKGVVAIVVLTMATMFIETGRIGWALLFVSKKQAPRGSSRGAWGLQVVGAVDETTKRSQSRSPVAMEDQRRASLGYR